MTSQTQCGRSIHSVLRRTHGERGHMHWLKPNKKLISFKMIPLFVVCHVPLLCFPPAWHERLEFRSEPCSSEVIQLAITSTVFTINPTVKIASAELESVWTWTCYEAFVGFVIIHLKNKTQKNWWAHYDIFLHINFRQGKRRTYSLACFIEKHSRGWLLFFESICCKNRPALLALRCFSRYCQVMSCTFPPFLIEQLKVTLESFGVTVRVVVSKGGWHFCALISQSRFPVGDTSMA